MNGTLDLMFSQCATISSRVAPLRTPIDMSNGHLAYLSSLTHDAEWLLLVAETPGGHPQAVGIILLDLAANKLLVELAENTVQDEDVREVLTYFKDEMRERASDVGAKAVFDSLEQELSLSIRIDGPRHPISTANPAETLGSLFRENVLERGQLNGASPATT